MGTLIEFPSQEKGARVTATQEGTTLVVRVETTVPMAPDELVVFPFGLEAKAARALVRGGTLRAAKIGRKLYAKRSDVLALVDTLAETRRRSRGGTARLSADEAYSALVASAAPRGRR